MPDFLQGLWSGIRETADLIGLTVLAAYLGRLLVHVGEVQRGRRRFFSKHLWWELVAAVAIGMIADGMAHQLGLTGPPRTAAIVTIAYLGPRGLEELIVRLIATRRGG
ncbi:phage holin family protein [Tistrella bauzanensis]|jgi:hypothetical protein|uniref:Phage holin family protein n=2 Tax=Tistrella TaxID=171436 RepID=A0ABU9YN94_9PROT|nr:phage holin family protein [Tistrella bauzanensis]GGB37662.1 hypothetical protein GCM10011505_18970 [Tistrella bauzanensis]